MTKGNNKVLCIKYKKVREILGLLRIGLKKKKVKTIYNTQVLRICYYTFNTDIIIHNIQNILKFYTNILGRILKIFYLLRKNI